MVVFSLLGLGFRLNPTFLINVTNFHFTNTTLSNCPILILSHGDSENVAPIDIIEESNGGDDNMTTISPEENMKNSSG